MNLVLRGKVTFVGINFIVIPYRYTLSKIMKGLMTGFSDVKIIDDLTKSLERRGLGEVERSKIRHSELEKWKQVESVLFLKIGEITCLPPIEGQIDAW